MDIGLFVSCLARTFLKNAVANVLTPFGLGWMPGGVSDYFAQRRAASDRVAELEAVVVNVLGTG